MKRIAIASIACLFSLMSLAADMSPHETVRRASELLLDVIEESQAYAETDEARFYSAVTEVLDPFVDFTAIARSVMAVHYKRATDEQRERFTTSFKSGLVRTYAKALLEFGDGGVDVIPPTTAPRNPERPTVKMEIRTTSGKVYPVSYSMALDKRGQWRMRNVIINGINIGLTFRSQFSAAMKKKKNNVDSVVDGWAALVENTDLDAPET